MKRFAFFPSASGQGWRGLSLCLFLAAMGVLARAEDLPKKEAGEAPEDPALFANPPIVLDERVKPVAVRPAMPVVQAPTAKADVVEQQEANVRRLQAQVEGLRKRAAHDPFARELLLGAESALRSALLLAAEAEAARQRSEQVRAAGQTVRPEPWPRLQSGPAVKSDSGGKPSP